jgi:hypothetical protein
MNTKMKLTALGVLLAGSLSGTQMAYASSDPLDTDCVNFTMLDWFERGPGGCQVDDKRWTLQAIGGDLTDTVADVIEVSFNAFGAGLLFQQVNLGPPIEPFPDAGDFTFDYTIEILDPKKVFVAVDLDADIPIPNDDTFVTKEVYFYDPEAGEDDPIDGKGLLIGSITTDGSPADPLALPGPRALWISERVVTTADTINSVTNVFQQAVPEPLSTSLLGAGLIGLAAIRRRRSTKA